MSFRIRMLSTKSFGITKILLLTNNRFFKNILCQGIVKIGDLLSNTGRFLQNSKVLTANLSLTQYFKLIGVVDAIPLHEDLL